jgi:subtilisin family serine protease
MPLFDRAERPSPRPRRAGRAVAAAAAGMLVLAGCSDDTPTEMARLPQERGDIVRLSVGTDDIVPYVTGQIIVQFASGTSRADVEQIVAAQGATVMEKMLLPDTWLIAVPAGQEKEVVAGLGSAARVDFAEPDYLTVVVPCETGSCNRPNDSFFGYKWDLHNNGGIRNSSGTLLSATGAVDADIDWLEAFEFLGSGFAGSATIAIVDTGIQNNHQDLAGRVILERNFATGYPDTLVSDRDGHGSHVAGIAAARGNNGVGVTGVAYGANIRLINAKGCDLYLFPNNVIQTSCPNSSTSNAIVWATDNGADVINLSLGGAPNATVGSAAQQAALQYARANNVLPFCSTGNDNYPGISFPARFPECVAVGATDWNDTRASYSNYSADIELSAPGGDGESLPNGYSLILSVDGDAAETVTNSYAWLAGTSMATPQVTGLAALLIANGMTNADSVLARLKSTADDLGSPGFDNQFGHGRINAYQAVTGWRLAAMDVQPATISLANSPSVSVVLYSKQGFDAAAVNVANVRMMVDSSAVGAPVAMRGTSYQSSATRDYNGDGRLDRVLTFTTGSLKAVGLTTSTSRLVLQDKTSASKWEARDESLPAFVP